MMMMMSGGRGNGDERGGSGREEKERRRHSSINVPRSRPRRSRGGDVSGVVAGVDGGAGADRGTRETREKGAFS